MFARAEDYKQEVLQGSNAHAKANLLHEFGSGYPVDQLRDLLTSPDDRVVEAGAWIAAELGAMAEPLMDAVLPLLGHPSRNVRFNILEVVFIGATQSHGNVIARSIGLIRDSDEAVRWRAWLLLAKQPHQLLASSLESQPDGQLQSLTLWLTTLEPGPVGHHGVEAKLASTDAVERLFAAAAAFRLYGAAPKLLEMAIASSDPEVASFASGLVRTKVKVKRSKGPAKVKWR